ncbi:conserved phage C-terminal domain-containing protein [Salipaludibacillus sp. HK11]|uniref:conserved phage C-terminal domain-containing protein n=1 Tax=Salipaludibacillus sp. HK11 TaxID=3394320 RepID=UPI0039FC30A6
MRGFKRSVIKEELLELTGDYKLAIVLNQMIYWSQCVRDFDRFIAEEKKRNEQSEMELTHGWFYKTASELAEDTLTNMAPSSIRRYLAKLIEAGWLDERSNQKMKWDRTKQFRVNLIKIQKDLNHIGLYLEGYKMPIPSTPEPVAVAGDDRELLATSSEKLPFSVELVTEEAEEIAPTKEPLVEIPEESPSETTDIPYSEIITYLNERTDKNFKATVRKTQELIRARWKENHHFPDFKKVIDTKTMQWINNPDMNKYLRPETLFGTKFEAYLNEGGPSQESAFEQFVKELE